MVVHYSYGERQSSESMEKPKQAKRRLREKQTMKRGRELPETARERGGELTHTSSLRREQFIQSSRRNPRSLASLSE